MPVSNKIFNHFVIFSRLCKKTMSKLERKLCLNRILSVISVIVVLTIAVNSERIRYDNYRVYEILPNSTKHIKLLNDIQLTSDSVIFLDEPYTLEKSIYAIVAPHKQSDFEEILNKNHIWYKLEEKNLQKHLDNEIHLEGRSAALREDYDWKSYHTLDETYDWLKSLTQKYPEQIELLTGGESYEGRSILGVKLSYKSGNKGIFIEGGIHAREWISPATVTYILNELLTSKDPDVRNIAENYDWYIFPHFNPDGYVYTHEKNRLWRKTRSQHGLCYGVDPNRNWNYHWNEIGASSYPCSETYSGPKAFSEIETKTLGKFIESIKDQISTYISFHSYSQLLLFPYGHTNQHAPNHNDLQEIGNVAAEALSKRYGTKYIVGNIYETIYPAAGASMDWVYGNLNVTLSYTYELRPSNTAWNGFILPPEFIIPTGQETLDSVLALIKHAKELGYYE